MALGVSLVLLLHYAVEHRRLVRDEVDEEKIVAALAHRPSYGFYAVGLAIGLLLPLVAVGFYLLLALYIGIPGRTLHRLLHRRR